MKQLRSRVTILAVGICLFVLPGLSNVPADAKPSKDAIQAGMTIPEVKFSKPASTKDQQSLGLEKNGPFTLLQLPSKFVLIEVLSSTWATCIANAPVVNRLYNIIQNDPELNREIKMMGLGMSDNDKKLNVWKKKLKIQFPLIADENLEVYFKLGRTGTPYMILATAKDGKVLWTHAGAVEDMEKTLGEIREFVKSH